MSHSRNPSWPLPPGGLPWPTPGNEEEINRRWPPPRRQRSPSRPYTSAPPPHEPDPLAHVWPQPLSPVVLPDAHYQVHDRRSERERLYARHGGAPDDEVHNLSYPGHRVDYKHDPVLDFDEEEDLPGATFGLERGRSRRRSERSERSSRSGRSVSSGVFPAPRKEEVDGDELHLDEHQFPQPPRHARRSSSSSRRRAAEEAEQAEDEGRDSSGSEGALLAGRSHWRRHSLARADEPGQELQEITPLARREGTHGSGSTHSGSGGGVRSPLMPPPDMRYEEWARTKPERDRAAVEVQRKRLQEHQRRQADEAMRKNPRLRRRHDVKVPLRARMLQRPWLVGGGVVLFVAVCAGVGWVAWYFGTGQNKA